MSGQHTTEPPVRTPQVRELTDEVLALTEVKVPDGGEDWPARLDPQHTTEPSVCTPQL